MVLMTLPTGVYVDVVGCTDWCKVSYRGVEGWTLPSLLGAVEYREEVYEPVPYGWYVLPTIGTAVTVFAIGDRFYYEDRGRRHFIDHSQIHRRHPFAHRDFRDERDDDPRAWRR